MSTLRVDFGLFDGDELLQKGFLIITDQEASVSYDDLNFKHQLHNDVAEIIMEYFSDGEKLFKSTLSMPVHESDDWETIEQDKFTLAFKCILDS